MRRATAAGLVAIALAAAIALGNRARRWNADLAIAPPLARVPPRLDDPGTPRLTERVVLVIVDGLGADEAHLPYLEELGRRGAATTARVPYPTVSRPNYVTILTGVPPRDSGVRANRVEAPVAVDTVMDRARGAGLTVASASDFGVMVSLFLRNTASIAGVDWIERGSQLIPPPPMTWPLDEAHRVRSLEELGPLIASLAGRMQLVAVLVLDVDRAGHAAGVGDAYRAAAAATDRMLRTAFAGIDLARSTVIVTADHGHVAPGGHGGREREVSTVPLVLAGAGIVPGAAARDATLVDVAPTVAALLGLPAPGHAEGRALVELLQLAAADAARRADADAARAAALAPVIAVRGPGPDPLRLVVIAAGAAATVLAARALRRRGAIALSPGALTGAIALGAMMLAIVAITRGRLSPSYVPSLARTIQLGAAGGAVAITAQLVASWRVVRRAPDRLAAANGVALIGLAAALGGVALARTWFSPPFLDVPPPSWMVVVPTIDLAAATCALAVVILVALAALRPRTRHLGTR